MATRSTRRSLSVIAVLVVMIAALVATPAAASAAPMPRGNNWGGAGYTDYYGFCYYMNKKPARPPATFYRTFYVGAVMNGHPGTGVTCLAKAVPINGPWLWSTSYNRYYSWDTICRLSGWRGGLQSVDRYGMLRCRG